MTLLKKALFCSVARMTVSRSEIALFQMELEIKDARFSRLEPRKRPAYVQNGRYEILVIRSARGWNNAPLAKRFHVTVQTIQNGLRRAEAGNETVPMPVKVTRYPEFVLLSFNSSKPAVPCSGDSKLPRYSLGYRHPADVYFG